MKIRILLLTWLLGIASCIPADKPVVTATAIPVSPTPTVTPTSSVYIPTPVAHLTPYPTITPKVITPFVMTSEDDEISNLEDIIVDIYSIDLSCTHSVFKDEPEIRTEVEFNPIEQLESLDIRWTQAIANSPDQTLQAQVICVANTPDSDSCFDHLYLINLKTDSVIEILFSYHLAWRPIFYPIWIGNRVLAFAESTNSTISHIYAVDVEKKEYIYFSLHHRDCHGGSNE